MFEAALSDGPEHKNDLVGDKYTMPALKEKTKVATELVDFLAEEVMVTKEV